MPIRLDYVFLVNASSSMQPCLEAIKSNIRNFVAKLISDNEDRLTRKDWRISICTYHDRSDTPGQGEDILHTTPFTNDVDELNNQLDNIRCEGGNNYAPLLEALDRIHVYNKAARNAFSDSDRWYHGREVWRSITVFTDAPFHAEKEVHPYSDFLSIITSIEQKRIVLTLFAPEMECYYSLASIERCNYEPTESDCNHSNKSDYAHALVKLLNTPKCFMHAMEHVDIVLDAAYDSSSPPTFEEEYTMNEETITQEYAPAKKQGIVDIIFLLDATGSMQPCIDAVKNNIHRFVTTLTSEDANGGVLLKDWRASICLYRDFTYDPKHGKEALHINSFTSDVNELYKQLDAITAEGGGDEPESLLDALYKVINIGKTAKGATPENNKWRYPSDAARCVIVFTDASYHPTMQVVPGAGLQDVLDIITQERIRLSLFAPEMECHYALANADRCVYETVEVAPDTNAARALLDFVNDKENFQRTMELLAKSISMSASEDMDEL